MVAELIAKLRRPQPFHDYLRRGNGPRFTYCPLVRSQPYSGGEVIYWGEKWVAVRLTYPAHLLDLGTGQGRDFPAGSVVRFATT